jgi:hypothetical protein
MDERYGADHSQDIQDTQWIEEATLSGDVLLCKDLAVAQNPLEAQAVYMTSAHVYSPCRAPVFPALLWRSGTWNTRPRSSRQR